MKKVITIVVLATTMFSFGRAQTCDTLFNLLSAHDTATLIPIDTDYGYISGNNAYGDFAVAEAYPVADSGSFLTTATIYFGGIDINSTDTNTTVTVYVWDNTGISVFGNTAPGAAIDSAVVTLGQIALAVSENKGLLVHFASTTGLATDTVYVGIVFPTISGDDFAVLTNTFNGPDGNGWVLGYDPSAPETGAITWNSYNNNYGITSGSVGNYIVVSICPTPDPTPAAFFNSFIPNNCSPATLSVSDASFPTPTSITWLFGDGNTANGPTAGNTYTAGGAYTVTESVANDTSSTVIANFAPVVEVFVNATGTVNITQSPVITPTINRADGTSADGSVTIVVTSATSHYFITWTDQSNDTLSTDDTLSDVAPGQYVVTVQDQNGCTTQQTIEVDSIGTGILHLSPTQQLSVYPNPATDALNLVWSTQSNAEISVVSLNGDVLSTVISNGETKTLYDIHNLASGAYLLRITDKATSKQQSMLFTKF